MRRFVGLVAAIGSVAAFAACNNGSVTPVADAPLAPSAPGPPKITVTAVNPSQGATTTYGGEFTAAAGTSCGQGLLGGGALILDDGTVQDSADTNGFSGFAPFAIDQACTQSGMSSSGFPQRLASLPNVLHVTAIVVYLSPPVATFASTLYPSLAAAVTTSRYTTNLYMIAQPLGVVDASPASISGAWTGAVQDSSGGAGTLTLSLTQSDVRVAGTWSFVFLRSASNVSGTLAGAVFNGAVTLLLTPSTASCPIALQMNTSGSGTTTASYAPAPSCSLANMGSATITKH
jgi:hypothetical protein